MARAFFVLENQDAIAALLALGQPVGIGVRFDDPQPAKEVYKIVTSETPGTSREVRYTNQRLALRTSRVDYSA
jgi:hypothetical protein